MHTGQTLPAEPFSAAHWVAVFAMPRATKLHHQPLMFNISMLRLQEYSVDVKPFQLSGAHFVIYHRSSPENIACGLNKMGSHCWSGVFYRHQ